MKQEKTMKKGVTTLIAAALVCLLAVPAIAFATSEGGEVQPAVAEEQQTEVAAVVEEAVVVEEPAVEPAGQRFIDADGDGVCDNYNGTQPGGGKGYGNGAGQGAGFVDADGDGICDNYGNRPADGTGNKYGQNNGQGQGQGNGAGQGQGQGGGYVDANGDGVCDNYNGQGKGQGGGRGCKAA